MRSAGPEAYCQQNDPHPSDGRGTSQTRLSQLPKRLDTPTDGGRFSLSHPMGEGRGEGDSAPKSEVVFARVLRRNCAVEAVERVICRLRISKLNNVPVAQNISLEILPGGKVGGTLNPHRLRARSLEFQLETTKSRIQKPEGRCYLRQIK